MAFKGSAESKVTFSLPFPGADIKFESGWIAKQADGAVVVRQGDTMVLCTVCGGPAKPNQDFFPLVCEYQEKYYAAGKIPGGFFKREARPGEQEILTCRLIDRPIRPLFPDGYFNEVQVICTVMSVDPKHPPDVLAICGASAALHISELPFGGPLAGVRVGRVNGKLMVNPSRAELVDSDLEFIVAGTKDAIVMVEGGAKMVPETDVLEALYFGHNEVKKICQLQEEMRAKLGKPKQEVVLAEPDAALVTKIKGIIGTRLSEVYSTHAKQERSSLLSQIYADVHEKLGEELVGKEKEVGNIVEELSRTTARNKIVKDKIRIDGRDTKTVRPIECEVGVIPRAHGSSLFTRGETQAIVTATLGTSADAQRIDTVTDSGDKMFMLHYNFPPYSTGEVKMLRGTGRREVGHGNLAERAIRPLIPTGPDFQYVVRIVSDITESNGSSSMASVCGGSLALMDAGVKIREHVAGVAMGLIKEGDDVAVITDILGDEDHFGDMDFKVCGTASGITALQMDIKCTGLSRETMTQALDQAKAGRLHILEQMTKAITKSREDYSQYAPMIKTIKINPDKIREVIGPGGKVIRSITESTGVKIDISDDGTVSIASSDPEATKRAIAIIEGITAEAEIGKIYQGVVKRIMDFGAFVEILPGTEGLCHISQLDFSRVEQVTDVVREGDEIPVMVLDIDKQGRIRLSRKEALDRIKQEAM